MQGLGIKKLLQIILAVKLGQKRKELLWPDVISVVQKMNMKR